MRPITEKNSNSSSSSSSDDDGGVEYCSVGDDGYLRVWDLLGHRYDYDDDGYDDGGIIFKLLFL